MNEIFHECSQKTPMTHSVNRVTLSDLYQSDDPNVNKQVLKNLAAVKKKSRVLCKKRSTYSLLLRAP